MAKDWSLSRTLEIRYPLGMLRFANDKLCATGFRFPTGVGRRSSNHFLVVSKA